MAQVSKVSVSSSLCFTSFSFLDVVAQHPLLSVPACFVLTYLSSIQTSASSTSMARSCRYSSCMTQCTRRSTSAKQQHAEFLQRSDLQASRNRWQITCRVDQASRKLVQFRTENLLQQQFFSSQSKGKRDRDTNVVHSLKESKNLQTILERKLDSAVRGEMMAQQKMYEAEERFPTTPSHVDGQINQAQRDTD